MGPPACSCRSRARPSQNCATLRLEFRTVGELIGPRCQRSPIEVGKLSEPPIDRLWHELHEMKPDLDRRGSKKSFLPSSAMPMLICFGGRIGVIGSSSGLAGGDIWAVAVAARIVAPVTAIAAAMDFSFMFLLPRLATAGIGIRSHDPSIARTGKGVLTRIKPIGTRPARAGTREGACPDARSGVGAQDLEQFRLDLQLVLRVAEGGAVDHEHVLGALAE